MERWLTESELQGFLIVGNRFVDRFGHSRIGELQRVFHTDCPDGRRALAVSLAHVAANLGSYEQFARAFPVTIIPPLPAYPLLQIVESKSCNPPYSGCSVEVIAKSPTSVPLGTSRCGRSPANRYCVQRRVATGARTRNGRRQRKRVERCKSCQPGATARSAQQYARPQSSTPHL
jgi:hypothetical protein